MTKAEVVFEKLAKVNMKEYYEATKALPQTMKALWRKHPKESTPKLLKALRKGLVLPAATVGAAGAGVGGYAGYKKVRE